jgi:dipeptidyl aminopeptidase/acylaminoacyl peptidase
MALLFAEHEPRLAGCVAYAPCVDVPGFLGGRMTFLSWQLPGLADFAVQSSPTTHESRLSCPVFLFHAEGDENVSVEESRSFANRLKGAGKDVTIVTVPGGDHYQSMIDQGIPKGIEWLKGKTGKK